MNPRLSRLPGSLLLLALASATGGSAWAQAQPDRPQGALGQAPAPKVAGVDVTFLANEGFFLESGKYHVLIDAFLREPTNYEALPNEVYKELVNARPPYDGLTVVLVSHDHPDHMQVRGLEKYLSNNKRAQLLASRQVIEAVEKGAREFEAIRPNVTPIPTRRGSSNRLMQEEMSVEFIELAHVGKGNESVQNLGHLIEIGGVKILHVGDADPTAENFEAYQLEKRGIDLAILPYWFFGSETGLRVISEQIRPRMVAASHVPPGEKEALEKMLAEGLPNVILFQGLEKRRFEPRAAPEAPAEGEDG